MKINKPYKNKKYVKLYKILPKVFQMRGKMASEALKCSINVSFSGCGFLGKLFNLCFLTILKRSTNPMSKSKCYTTESEQNLQDSLKYKISQSDLTRKIICKQKFNHKFQRVAFFYLSYRLKKLSNDSINLMKIEISFIALQICLGQEP